MKIFISDLHLGDGSATDDFHRDKEFMQFLDFIEAEAHDLIIVGDFLELWQADLDKVLFVHSQVIGRLLALMQAGKFTYVVGNHDFIPFIRFTERNLSVCAEYRDEPLGLVAEHGHRYDIFNRYRNPLRAVSWPAGKYFTLAIASLERLVHPDVDRWAKKAFEYLGDFWQEATYIRNKIPPSTKEYLRRGGHFGEFKEAVQRHLDRGAKIVIFGHTHLAQLQRLNKGIYANCGTWVDGATPTYIACEQQLIELREAGTHRIIDSLKVS